jgi:predicted DCC family thiol-disulfide oxidoreductase YuxK
MPNLPLLVYDGDCGFCMKSIHWAQKHLRNMPDTAAYQRLDLSELGLTAETCQCAVQLVHTDGHIDAAHNAVRVLLVQSGGFWSLVGRAMQLPGVKGLSGVVYRWIAANRHVMPGASGACTLRPQ